MRRMEQIDRLIHRPAPALAATLARELHDGPGQRLAFLHWELRALERRYGDGPIVTGAQERGRVPGRGGPLLPRDVLSSPPSRSDGQDLLSALQSLVTRLTRGCDAITPPAPTPRLHLHIRHLRLTDERAVDLLCLVREALNNAIRHADARHIHVSVNGGACGAGGAGDAGGDAHAGGSRLLSIGVSDDGCGFDRRHAARADAFGLIGMRERAALLGATLAVESTPGVGTRVQVTLPLLAQESVA